MRSCFFSETHANCVEIGETDIWMLATKTLHCIDLYVKWFHENDRCTFRRLHYIALNQLNSPLSTDGLWLLWEIRHGIDLFRRISFEENTRTYEYLHHCRVYRLERGFALHTHTLHWLSCYIYISMWFFTAFAVSDTLWLAIKQIAGLTKIVVQFNSIGPFNSVEC